MKNKHFFRKINISLIFHQHFITNTSTTFLHQQNIHVSPKKEQQLVQKTFLPLHKINTSSAKNKLKIYFGWMLTNDFSFVDAQLAEISSQNWRVDERFTFS